MTLVTFGLPRLTGPGGAFLLTGHSGWVDDFCKPLPSSHCDPGAGKSQGQARPSGLLTWLASSVDPRNVPSGLEQQRAPTCPPECLCRPLQSACHSLAACQEPGLHQGRGEEMGQGSLTAFPSPAPAAQPASSRGWLWGLWRAGQASRGHRVGGALLSSSCCREVGEVKDGPSGSRLLGGCSVGRPAVVGRTLSRSGWVLTSAPRLLALHAHIPGLQYSSIWAQYDAFVFQAFPFPHLQRDFPESGAHRSRLTCHHSTLFLQDGQRP